MFKILSDPTKSRVTEVDLSHAGAQVSFLQGVSWNGKDIVNERPDGGSVVFSRRSRSNVQLQIVKGLQSEDWEKLIRMRNNGDFVELGPNWDSHTVFYAPLGDSTKALVKNYPSHTYTYDSGTYAGMGQVRQEYDSETKQFTEIPADSPRFIQSNLGKGIYLSDGIENLAPNNGHSTNLVNIWGVNAGLGFVDFVTFESSPAVTYSGVTRCKVPSSSDVGAGTDSFLTQANANVSTNDVVAATIWLKGRGVITKLESRAALLIDSLSNIELTSEWKEYKLRGVSFTPSSNPRINIIMERDNCEQEVLIGPVSWVKQNTVGNDNMPVCYWDRGNSGGNETVTYASGPSFPQDEMTLTIMGTLPAPDENVRFIDALETSTRNVIGIYEGSLRFFFATDDSGSNGLTFSTGITDADTGKPFWICARAKIGDNRLQVDANFNGRKVTEFDTSVQNFLSTDRGQIELGTSDTQKPARTAPQQIRIDNRYWSDEEVALHQTMYTEPHWRSFLMQTLGKRYRIADIAVEPAYANWETLQGRLTLEEIDEIEGMGVAL